MRSHALACAVAVAAVVAVSGCGSSDDDAATTDAGTAAATTQSSGTNKPVKAAYLASASNDFLQATQKGFEDTIKAQGGSMVLFNANFDPQKQTGQCQDAITSGRFNVLVLSVFQPPTGVPCVAAAKAANIPVIAADTPVGTDPNAIEPQVDGVAGGVYITANATAKQTADLVKLACEGLDPCNVIAEVITPTDPVSNQQVDDLQKELPNVKVLQKVVTQFDPSQLVQKLPDVLSAHKDVDVFLAGADSEALAAVPVIKSAGLVGKVKILGGSGSRLGAKAVADGTLFGSTGTWPRQEGEALAEMAIKAVNGQPIEPKGVEALQLDGPQILTKDNIKEFTPEWGAQR